MSHRKTFDVVIVGGGIAGASLAYFLAERGVTNVLLLERESQPGYHATGRSAAVLSELDPISTLQQLKAAGATFLRTPPADFAETPLLTPSGIMLLFHEPRWSALRQAAAVIAEGGIRIELLTPAEATARVPVLLPDRFAGAALLPEDGHIDVHALLTGYLRGARHRGVEQRCGGEVRSIDVSGGRVTGVSTESETIAARWVVNAAGAWAGAVGELAGATPIRLVPHRRTIITFAATLDVSGWPMVASDEDRIYFAPESGGLKLSPMDEEPMAPADAHADDVAIAGGLDRLGRLAPALVPQTLGRRWAGLRTFAPDRVLAVGEDPRVKGFFWLAGQGGCGIETSPIVGQIAADLITHGRTARFDAGLLAPDRFAA